MGREDDRVGPRHPLAQHGEDGGHLLGHRIADGVGDVDGGGAVGDGDFDASAQELVLGARAVLGAPLDIVDMAPGQGDAAGDGVQHLVRRHLQLVLHMQGAGRDESVNARPGGRPQRFGRPLDVGALGARQAAYGGGLDHLGDGMDRLEIAVGGDREAGLDDVDAHLLQNAGDAQLLFQVHRGAGRLLAVAQGGIENDDAVRGVALTAVDVDCVAHALGPST